MLLGDWAWLEVGQWRNNLEECILGTCSSFLSQLFPSHSASWLPWLEHLLFAVLFCHSVSTLELIDLGMKL